MFKEARKEPAEGMDFIESLEGHQREIGAANPPTPTA